MTATGQAISVIIPTFNRAPELAECLAALRKQTYQPIEVIVVDDGSTDGTNDVVRDYNATLLNAGGGKQANYCRNQGATRARGDILMFFDSDTVPSPEALAVAARILVNPTVDAVVGLYSVRHRHSNAASQYKNLWIRYSYLKSAGHIDWIFGAVSAIRKDAFLKAGGFDQAMMMTHGGEDLELGKRMATRGLTIVLDPACEVEHLKQHTLASLLRNDLMRSDGFVRVAGKVGHLRQSVRTGFVNVYPAFVFSVPISCAVLVSGIGAVAWNWLQMPFIVFLILYGSLNASFLFYFARHKGVVQTIQVSVILFADHLACALGGARGLWRYITQCSVR
ncbi:MAG: glycosyltransferase [Bacteroidota bacterium]